jgi:hypothetical protein
MGLDCENDMKLSLTLATLIVFTSLIAPVNALAQSQIRIVNPEPGVNDRLGSAMASDGEWLLVGVPGDTTSVATAAGAVYAYELVDGRYVQRAKLIANDGANGDSFGAAIDISGDTAIIGAWKDNLAAGSGAGSAYVFGRVGSTWVQRTKLQAPDAATGDGFGVAASISGDAFIIGAFNDDVNGVGASAGSAHVYRLNAGNWIHSAQLFASDGNQFARFGASVAISADHLLIGARNADADAGAVYAFIQSASTVNFQAKLFASDSGLTDGFGYSISLDGNTALIGAPNHSVNGVATGAAYIFTRGDAGWAQQSKLVEPAARASDQFGYAVALSGTEAAIGMPFSGTGIGSCLDCGSASFYQRFGANWTRVSRLLASNQENSENLGAAVALTQDGAVVGAPNANGVDAGLNDAGNFVQFVLPLSQFRDGFE